MADHQHNHSHSHPHPHPHAEDTGQVSTTGHQWDDEEGFPLQEYNNPLPTWWLYSFYATIVYSVIYWFLYPAWPLVNDFTKGFLGASMYQELADEEAAAKVARQGFETELANMSLEDVIKDNRMMQFAMSGGKAIFGDRCAPCHGAGGVGSQAKGFPVLVDDDWLYGGTLAAIQETITNGRTGMMPAHDQAAGGSFTAAQVGDLTEYVLSLTKRATDAEAAKRGDALYHGEASCNACHGDDAKGSVLGKVGDQEVDDSMGAPNLTDGLWLYGSTPEIIKTSIAKGRAGEMPAWGASGRLSPLEIKEVTVYVYSLGGGK